MCLIVYLYLYACVSRYGVYIMFIFWTISAGFTVAACSEQSAGYSCWIRASTKCRVGAGHLGMAPTNCRRTPLISKGSLRVQMYVFECLPFWISRLRRFAAGFDYPPTCPYYHLFRLPSTTPRSLVVHALDKELGKIAFCSAPRSSSPGQHVSGSHKRLTRRRRSEALPLRQHQHDVAATPSS